LRCSSSSSRTLVESDLADRAALREAFPDRREELRADAEETAGDDDAGSARVGDREDARVVE
jgi:hypothetical protein